MSLALISPGLPLPEHPNQTGGETVTRRAAVFGSPGPHPSINTPQSLCLIYQTTPKSFLATPSYYTQRADELCQYHLTLGFHPTLPLPAKNHKSPQIILLSGQDSVTAPAKSPSISNSIQSHKAGATRTGEQKISHL